MTKRFTAESVAKIFEVPYWLITDEPRPSWLRRPLWRFRVWRWARCEGRGDAA